MFNQPIEDVHVISGQAALLVGKSADSVTFQRSQSSNQTVKVLVTEASGVKAQLTLQIPQATEVSMASSSNAAPSGTPVAFKNSPPPSGKSAPIVYFGPSSGRRIYITIDDGWFPSQRVLQLMQQQHVPITAFLIQQAASEHLNYWNAFVKAGGIIQDHTVNHPWLTRVSFQNDISEWAGPVQTYPKWFGQTPTLGRPPYGAVNTAVQIAAHKAGLQDIVMWSAEFDPADPAKGLQTWNNQPLSPGEIVLLHWQPGLYNELQNVLSICKKRGLVPAPLVFGPSQTSTTSTVYNGGSDAPTNATNHTTTNSTDTAIRSTANTTTENTTGATTPNTDSNTTTGVPTQSIPDPVTNRIPETTTTTPKTNTPETVVNPTGVIQITSPIANQTVKSGDTIAISGTVANGFGNQIVQVTLLLPAFILIIKVAE